MKQPTKEQRRQIILIEYKCEKCTRTFWSSFLKAPLCCPFCTQEKPKLTKKEITVND